MAVSLGHFGGDQNYRISGAGTQDTVMPLSLDGLHLEFTLTSANTMSVAITPHGGSPSTFTENLFFQGNAIQAVSLHGSSDTLSSHDAFINSISVVPEPSSYAT